MSAMLPDSEVTLLAAIGVAGTAFGGWMAARVGRAAAGGTDAARDQRAREAGRRRDDRTADLYGELLAEMTRSERRKFGVLHRARDEEPGPRESDEPLGDGEADEFWSWRARVIVFASDEVRSLWEAWHAILLEGWSPKAADDRRGRLRAAREQVEQQMRSELIRNAETQGKDPMPRRLI
jgi:hypothetical protein